LFVHGLENHSADRADGAARFRVAPVDFPLRPPVLAGMQKASKQNKNMKAKGIIIPLLLLLALFGAVQRAGATTKTVTYSLSRGMDASYEYVYLTHSGNAPFDGTTEVTRQLMSNRTYASFDLPDGFRLSFDWKGAEMTSTAYSIGTNFFCAGENVEFYLSWNLTSRYVTSVSVTDISGNPSALNGGGTASTDFNFREQGNIT
jgi:hypothetical protein